MPLVLWCDGGMWSDVLSVVFPVSCVGCGAWDVLLCGQCRVVLGLDGVDVGVWCGQWRVLSCGEGVVGAVAGEGISGLAGTGCEVAHWALGEYAGVVRELILAAKHRPQVRLDAVLLECGRLLGGRVGASVLASVWVGRRVRVVPAPSRLRRRFVGREVALPLAVGVARGLSDALGCEVSMEESFRLRWGAGTQAGKSGVQRQRGRVGTMVCERPFEESEVVIFVDDIVTTGATIAEMTRAGGRCPDAVVSACWVSR